MAFIAFEGGEGTGKSTQMKMAAEWLRSRGIACHETREPGGSPLAEKIRSLFKEVPEHGDVPTPLTELMLVMASRAQHIAKTIQPAMARKEWILCDRFLDSTYVYQGAIGKLSKKEIDTAASLVLNGITPDLTLIFSVPADLAAARRAQRAAAANEARDRLDEVHDEVHSKIDKGFRNIIEEAVPYPSGKIPVRVLIDSRGGPDEVQAEVRKAISQVLGI